jgi:hypothetical protein
MTDLSQLDASVFLLFLNTNIEQLSLIGGYYVNKCVLLTPVIFYGVGNRGQLLTEVQQY